MDIPLSRPFVKLLCMGEVGSNLARHYVVEHPHHHHLKSGATVGADNSTSSSEDEDSDAEMTTPSEVSIP